MATDVMTGDAALTRCVTCTPEEFAAEYWGCQPLLSRAGELTGDFSDLFSPEAVDELASERGLRTPFLRMAKDGSVRPATNYTRGGGAGAAVADQAADDKILSQLAEGTTLVLQGLHRTWPPLVQFATRLAAELGHPVQINAYITPSGSQGFAPHHDVHDVFVLQVAGTKRWTIHDAVVPDPLDNQPFDGYKSEIATRVAEPPRIDTVLAPGDALYLPRGAVHSAQAQGETSIHLTVGIHPLTRYGLVRFLLDAVQDDPALRMSLPMGVDLGSTEALAPHLQMTVEALKRALDDVSPQHIAERVAANLRQRTRPEPIGPLAQLAAAEALEAQTELRLREALRWQVRPGPTGRDDVEIRFLDRSISVPAEAAEALHFIATSPGFRPGELPGLSADDGLVLARRLLREGVLVRA